MVLGMKLTVIIVATLLMACMVTGVAVAQKASPDAVLKELDSLTLKTDDLSNSVESQLVDMNIALNSMNNTTAAPANRADSLRSIASRGTSDADAFEAQLSELEKGLWTIQSRYDPGKYGNKDATAIESRMSYLQSRISYTRNMINDMRIAADRINREV